MQQRGGDGAGALFVGRGDDGGGGGDGQQPAQSVQKLQLLVLDLRLQPLQSDVLLLLRLLRLQLTMLLLQSPLLQLLLLMALKLLQQLLNLRLVAGLLIPSRRQRAWAHVVKIQERGFITIAIAAMRPASCREHHVVEVQLERIVRLQQPAKALRVALRRA